MNLILFEPEEISRPLRRDDPRAVHVLGTLRLEPGGQFDAGVVNGARGKALIHAVGVDMIQFEFSPLEGPLPCDPIDVIVGMPRPQSAKRILHDAAALGLRGITFASTARSDPNYAKSRLWAAGEWRHHLIDGAQQAFDTRTPGVMYQKTLREAVVASPPGVRIAFDNYEATVPLPQFMRREASPALKGGRAAVLAFGPERGWHADDRQLLRDSGFTIASLGRRVMRVETAIASAVAVLRAEVGWD